MKVLLDSGCEIEAREGRGRTPFLLAAKHGHLGLCQFLLTRGCDINTVNSVGPLQQPKFSINYELPIQDSASALYAAAFRGHLSVVQWLVASGVSIHQANHVAPPSFPHASETQKPLSILTKTRSSKPMPFFSPVSKAGRSFFFFFFVLKRPHSECREEQLPFLLLPKKIIWMCASFSPLSVPRLIVVFTWDICCLSFRY